METMLLYDVDNYLCWDKAKSSNMHFENLKIVWCFVGPEAGTLEELIIPGGPEITEQ